MIKPELGTKRVCVSCGARFYDLNRQPAICPNCSTEQPSDQPRIRRMPAGLTEERRRPKVVPVPGPEDAEVETETTEEEAEEDVLEDTSDLEDGAETMVDVEVEPESDQETE